MNKICQKYTNLYQKGGLIIGILSKDYGFS